MSTPTSRDLAPKKGCLLPTCTPSPSSRTLQRCSGCKAVAYCSQEHQLADWAAHKPFCDNLRKLQRALDREERKLLRSTDMFRTSSHADIFTNPRKVGHFWGLLETRDYMRARNQVFWALLRDCDALLGQKLAAQHGWDMLRLCTSDNLGVRNVLPGILVQIGEDQKAFDLCRYWVDYYFRPPSSSDEDEDEDEDAIPEEEVVERYLRPEFVNRDLFENIPEEWLTSRYGPPVSHIVPITLLKIRAYVDLDVLTRHFGEDVSVSALSSLDPAALQEVSSQRPFGISGCILRRAASANSPSSARDERSLKTLRAILSTQLTPLLELIKKRNQWFLAALLCTCAPGVADPEGRTLERYLKARPDYYSPTSEEEAQLLVQYNWKSWVGDGEVLAEVRRRVGTGH
ncbi:hypothetical protein CVT26_011685 [Gymnopilus dilepis]|uniref:MYND-type domain-containing protein n=1 Tax=Gymnopilus dilepis TaxID=231916 RepID=A0A409W8X7_9AGAR|nr:hypothetical protein CVT26_011685 [Gymnopilus dilepis]